MDDLLKEAIADAKAVRETALANAKMALEEAFTPKLKSMLSKKIQSEIDMDEQDDEEAPEEEEPAEEEGEEDSGDGFGAEEPAVEPEEGEMEDEEAEEPEDEMEAEGVIEINGVKYAPVVAEQDEEEAEEAPAEEEEAEEEPAEEEGEEEAGEEGEEEVVDDLTDAGAESDSDLDSSDVGDAENKEPPPEASDSSDAGQGSEEPADAGDSAEGEEGEEEVVDDLQDGVENEDIDLEEILKALTEDDEEAEEEDAEALKNELEEHRKVVRYLRSKLNEVNLLNAKLLFTNKLFRAHSLSEEKKVKVIETFDRARTLREVKLVYATMAESFGGGAKRGIKESKGSASKAVASTKSKSRKVISEASSLRNRFKKLANINS